MNADKNPDPPSSPSEGSISNEEDKDMYDSCDGDGKEISANLYICLGTSEDAGSFLSWRTRKVDRAQPNRIHEASSCSRTGKAAKKIFNYPQKRPVTQYILLIFH